MNNTKVIKLYGHHPDAVTPAYYTDQATGADVFSPIDVLIKSKSHAVIDIGISLTIPEGYDLQVRSRSGLAAKHGIIVLNSPGTIDCDYKDTIKIILANLGDEDYQVKKGDRIAQLVLTSFYKIAFEIYGQNGSKPRAGGLGSTDSVGYNYK